MHALSDEQQSNVICRPPGLWTGGRAGCFVVRELVSPDCGCGFAAEVSFAAQMVSNGNEGWRAYGPYDTDAPQTYPFLNWMNSGLKGTPFEPVEHGPSVKARRQALPSHPQ